MPIRTVFLLGVFGAGLLLVMLIIAGAGFYEVEGTSMAGSYSPGDVLLVESLSLWLHAAPERFDCVVINDPEKPGSRMIKRVVGLPGEKVELNRGRLIVEGRTVEMPPDVHGVVSVGPVDTGKGFFLVGDNLEESRDSRRFGVVDRSRIIGRVLMRLKKARQKRYPETLKEQE